MRVIDATTALPAGAVARHLRVRGHTLRLITASGGSDALVSETFWPPGMLGVTPLEDAPAPDLTVVDLVREPAAIAALLDDAAASGTAGDFELTRGYRQPRHDGSTWTVFTLRDANIDEDAVLVRTEDRLTLVRPPTGLGDRWLTRIVRDIATRVAKAEGSLVLHSSAFVHAGGAYLVIGDSGAGKSTTAVALARLLPDAGWMGNDRMHLDRRAEDYEVTACPLPLAINKGSLDVMGITDFASWPVRAGFPPPGSDWDRLHGEDKLKLSSREVHRHLGVPVVPHSELAGVVLPTVDLTADYAFATADPDHTAEVVRRNCFSLDDNLYGEDWLGVPVHDRAEPPSLDVFLTDLGKLPVLRCTLTGASDVSRLADDFRAAVRR
ncbi:hypothetical protein [Streptomyces ossamyceticus]|uniref:hypothetical protein n=1 Tax=Streptomyces ossamyceticus TaxID=249581 RepID=UPI0006E22F16|nr:hypothetical protein [Streptomyces ossamyceticus]